MNDPIHVGIAGLNAKGGWAQRSHLQALRSLDEYFISSVVESSIELAQEAAETFHIPSVHAGAEELAQNDSDDLIVVAANSTLHKALADPVMEACKMAFCEWPLGNGRQDAAAMAATAQKIGVRTLVGLQARSAPTIRFLKDLLHEGYVGDVLSTTLVGSGSGWGAQDDRREGYLYGLSNKASLFAVPFGHAIDALCYCLGEFDEVSARLGAGREMFTAEMKCEQRPLGMVTQIAVTGKLKSGAVVVAHYRRGSFRATNLRWEINGTKGDLVVTAPSGHIQVTPLTLHGATGEDQTMQVLEVPERYRRAPASLQGAAINVAEAYRQFALGDAAEFPVPDFEAAVERYRLLDAIESAARTGRLVHLDSMAVKERSNVPT